MSWYRHGSKSWLLKTINTAPQGDGFLAELEAALVAELAMRRPRSWLVSALRERIAWMKSRINVLAEIHLVRGGTLPVPAAGRYFGATHDFLRLAEDRSSAKPASREEAEAWLAQQPAEGRVYAYSICGSTLYFGPAPLAHAA